MIALLITFAYMFAFSYLALRFACAAPPKKVDKGQTPPHRLRPSEDTAPMSIMFTSDTIEKVRAEAHATGRELRLEMLQLQLTFNMVGSLPTTKRCLLNR